MFIPSFKLERTESGELEEATKGALWTFLLHITSISATIIWGHMYVLKAPYTTTSKEGIAGFGPV